ncbi:MAG: hypothetical protein ABSG85_19150 [Spirochaetia bacterium]
MPDYGYGLILAAGQDSITRFSSHQGMPADVQIVDKFTVHTQNDPASMVVGLHHFSAHSFSLGLVEPAGKGGALCVYDAGRTICDLFRFRRRLGTDVAAVALREYLRRRSRNIPKLLDYSQKLRISSPVRQALEILV